MFGRTLFHYEAPEDGAGAAPETDAGTPEPAPWALAQNDWDDLQASLDETRNALGYALDELGRRQQPEQAGAPQPQGFEWDPYGENANAQLAAYLDQRDQRMLAQFGEMLGPLQQHSEAQRLAEGDERAWDILDDMATREGDFNKEAAYAVAQILFPQAAQQYGNSPRAAEAALVEAASQVRAWAKSEREAAVNEYKASIETRVGARSELPATSQGVTATPDDESVSDVVK